MIFKPEMVEKILAGEKTVTRRPVKREVWDAGLKGLALPCRYKVGRDYAIQKGRNEKAVARLSVLDVERKTLPVYMLTPECNREGFPNFTAFSDYWTALYGSYDPTQLVDRIEFELLPTNPEQKGGQVDD